jgi:hypothetical protein
VQSPWGSSPSRIRRFFSCAQRTRLSVIAPIACLVEAASEGLAVDRDHLPVRGLVESLDPAQQPTFELGP